MFIEDIVHPKRSLCQQGRKMNVKFDCLETRNPFFLATTSFQGWRPEPGWLSTATFGRTYRRTDETDGLLTFHLAELSKFWYNEVGLRFPSLDSASTWAEGVRARAEKTATKCLARNENPPTLFTEDLTKQGVYLCAVSALRCYF